MSHVLCNFKGWLQIWFLVFASLPGFLTKKTKIKTKIFTIKVLSRNDHGQPKIKLLKKEYRILALQGYL